MIVLIFLLSFLWPYIKLPFDTSITIEGGDYLPNLHSSLNDPVRFFLFISLPLGFYFFYKLFFYKFKLNFFLNKFCFNIEDYYKPDSFIYKNKDSELRWYVNVEMDLYAWFGPGNYYNIIRDFIFNLTLQAPCLFYLL